VHEIPADLKSALADRYVVDRLIGRGGMATVYLASDVRHRRQVAVKVLLPVFSEGHAIVADFGIAKAVSSSGGETLTRSGFPLGTPGYMSPEQAAGLTDLDARADVYGVGCVFYEMVVGATPGLWLTEEAVTLGRFVDAEPDHRERLDMMPGRVEQALARALAMRRRDRYATPDEFVRALEYAGAGNAKLTDTEVATVLSRAADLQAKHPTVDGSLTLGVLEEVAAEVGLRPESVRDAARAVAGERAKGMGYGDEEVREILARAVQQSAIQTVEGGALSIGAVEQVGAQVGIAPRYVRAAVHETRKRVAAGSMHTVWRQLFDWPTDVTFDRDVDGEIDEEDVPLLGREIDAAFGTAGRITKRGDSIVWKPVEEFDDRTAQVAMNSRDGQIGIRVEENVKLAGLYTLMPILGAVTGGLFGSALAFALNGAENPLVVLPTALCALAGADLAAGAALTTKRRKRRSVLLQAVDRIQAFVERLQRS